MQQKSVLGLLVVSLLVLVGVTAYFVRSRTDFSVPLPFRASESKQDAKAEKPAAESSSAKESAKAKPLLKRKRRPIREAVETGQHAAPAIRALEATLARPEVQRPFPTANQIPAGMSRDELETVFKAPSIKMVKVDQGRLVETYVYLRGDNDTTTFARLQNGRVVSAQTTGR
jgi:hypothetical protein